MISVVSLEADRASTMSEGFWIVSIVKEECQTLLFFSLDAEKAFNWVKWPYLFEVLNWFSLDHKSENWIKLLCTEPYVEVVTNGNISKPIKTEQRCRQGDPLSSLLLILAIQPFAIAVRTHRSISGINIGGQVMSVTAVLALWKRGPQMPQPTFAQLGSTVLL